MVRGRDRLGDEVAERLPSPSDDLLREQSYLVARGVRPMADLGACPADPALLDRIVTRLENKADSAAIPFVVEHDDGSASFGYARAGWTIDLYRWVLNTEIPQERRSQIIGLLLGYSADEIGRFCDADTGRRYMTSRSGAS
jgi:hypothetical protein